MKNVRRIALIALMLLSAPTFTMKTDSDSMYTAIAKWMVSVDWYKKLQIKAAVDKVKEIDWKKVAEKIRELATKK